MTDPITAEIIRRYLETTSTEIIESMCRSSPNPGFNEGRDCAAALYHYDGDEVSLVARADGVPTHIFAALTSVKECLDFFHGDLNPGDVLLVCDPYYGGSHIGDYTIVRPVFHEDRPIFFPAVRGHMMDMGGPIPSGANFDSREIWHEGFRLAPLRLYERGAPRRDVWNWLRANNRLPDLLRADLEAMIGACAVGERRIRDLCERYGVDTVEDSVAWIFDYAERSFRDRIRTWPDGSYHGEMTVDTDYAGGFDLPITAAVTVDGDELIVDFTGSAPACAGIVNSVAANTISNTFIAFSVLCPDIPINSGFYRPLTVVLPENSMVNATSPAPVAMSTVCCGGQITQAVMTACAQFAPELVGSAAIDIGGGFLFGMDTRGTEPAFHIQYETFAVCMGTGGAYGTDGWGAWPVPFSSMRIGTTEVAELQYPVHYLEAEYSTDSAAPGRWRGSPALVMRRVADGAAGMTANLAAQSLVHPLRGFAGGHHGAGNYWVIDEGGPSETIVGERAVIQPIDPDGVLFSQCGSGGGWGDPLDRDPAAVLDDVLDGYVSVDGAAHDYGVVVDLDRRAVLVDETAALRKRIREQCGNRISLGRQRTVRAAEIEHRVTAEVS